ncbi:uncharacterized protein UTRI_04992_B [Ustilago trichophora]|uniref:Mig1 protein n=1 Tax=Ustilago trichophora TaxID=86804 RepID=A0A5C3EI97_9BASI|nr:uncharacterized protein UTRI_04992_B [Ustilago trichophora]
MNRFCLLTLVVVLLFSSGKAAVDNTAIVPDDQTFWNWCAHKKARSDGGPRVCFKTLGGVHAGLSSEQSIHGFSNRADNAFGLLMNQDDHISFTFPDWTVLIEPYEGDCMYVKATKVASRAHPASGSWGQRYCPGNPILELIIPD